MSSTADSPTEQEHAPLDELTTAQQRVALIIADVHGPSTFERPNLRDEVDSASDVEEVIDDKARVMTSLKYTRLLNALSDAGYLTKEYQGGTSPIILDLGYDEERDEREIAPYGATGRLWDIVAQVLDREGLSESALGDVDEDDFNEVRDAVNRAVGRTVLVTVSEASKYRFNPDPYNLVRDKVETRHKSDE